MAAGRRRRPGHREAVRRLRGARRDRPAADRRGGRDLRSRDPGQRTGDGGARRAGDAAVRSARHPSGLRRGGRSQPSRPPPARTAGLPLRGAPGRGRLVQGRVDHAARLRLPAPRMERARPEGRALSGSRCGRRSRLVLELRQPAQALGQVPVARAEQLHRGRQQDGADDRRVDQDRGGEADADLLGQLIAGERERAEYRDHHERRARHDAGGALDAVGDRVVVAHAAVHGLADPADDEHVVVHREAEQDHEQEERDPGRDATDRLEVEQLLAVAVLEDEHEDAVGGADRQQVEDDRLDRDDDRAERDQQQDEREPEHEREHERRACRQVVDEVLRAGGHAGHRDLGAGELADGGGDDLGAQDLERALGRRVGAAALDRERDDGDGLVGADLDAEGLREPAARQRAIVQLLDRGLDRRGGDVVGLDHGRGRDGAAGERRLEPVVGLDDRLAARVALVARVLELDAEHGEAERDEQAAGQHRRHERALEDAGDDGAPDARLALGLVAALGDPRHAALLEPVLLSEEREHRGQEGHRPEDRDRDDEHRADAEADEDRVAGEQQTGHRGDHGQARDEHGTARRGGGDLDRGLGRVAAIALLHHPARVEHRVVHADGEADDHHELGHVGRERVEPADRPEQADRGRDGGGAEHERDTGGDDRAERDQQDDQQQGVGDALRLLAVLLVLGGDLLGGRRLAELLDAHAVVSGLDGGDGGERLVDELLRLRVGAGQLEAHEHRATVLGGQRGLDPGDALDPLEARRDVTHRGGHLKIVRALALHEHLLAGPVGEARGRDDLLAALGLAAPPRRVVEIVLADLAADDGGEDDEQDPAEDGRLAVLGAPSTCAGCGIAGLHRALLGRRFLRCKAA